MSNAYWSISLKEVFEQLKSSPNGLTDEEASDRLKFYGRNSEQSNSRVTGVLLFVSQFKSPITILLLFAAILSFSLGDATNATIILVIVFISSVLGWWQEKGAADAMEQLLKVVHIRCNAIRNNQTVEVLLEEIVPGDIVHLSAGDIIPGDGILIESNDLFVDEAAFTGESMPVEKHEGSLPEQTPLAKRVNTLFMGSHVVSGSGGLLVINTFKKTELGKISDRLKLRPDETDFEKGLRRFGYFLMELTLILVVLIFAINVYLDKPVLQSFLFSLALAVGLTPQLLPAIVSVNLAAGARRMAKDKVIVKRLSAIENLGSMNILCSDKTGTLTEGKVVLNSAISIDGAPSDKVLRYASLNARLQKGFSNPIDTAITNAQAFDINAVSLISEVPYDFIRKRLTIQFQDGAENIAVSKGALKQILEVCTYAETKDGHLFPLAEKTTEIEARFQQLSSSGLRTIGIAYTKVIGGRIFSKANERDMTFLGFLTFQDPLKSSIKETVQSLMQSGVQLKVITGDNALVARSVTHNIGLNSSEILTGSEMQAMTESALVQKCMNIHVFAEVEPNQKERIILALKKSGNVVGFLGDGINDAPALHSADVGISVDTAVDVAKAAADIVLQEQDLRVLEKGIAEGRKTFANTLKYVFMSTAANFGNMLSMSVASLFLTFLPLLPKQILLTNLLTDLPEMTIGKDRVDSIVVTRPYRWDIKFIIYFMLTFGLLSSVFDIATFWILLRVLHAGETAFQTGWFVESVVSAAMIVLVIRTRLSVFKSKPGLSLWISTVIVVVVVLAIPFTALSELFGFTSLPLKFYYLMLPIAGLYIAFAEIVKQLFYKYWRLQDTGK
jgi:Mg2+-importing ATPase